MTVQEMHIGIDLELQKLNTFATKNMLPQEKDWFINKEVTKFLNKKGFDDNVNRIDDVKELVKTSPLLPIKTDVNDNTYVDLPADYFKYIRSELRMGKKSCSNFTVRTIPQYTINIPIKLDIDLLNSFSIDITFIEGLKTVFDSSVDIPEDYYKSINFRKQKFLLIKALQIKLQENLKKYLTSPFSLYWQFGPEGYIKDTFILVSNTQLFNAVVTVNNSISDARPVISYIPDYKSKNYPIKSNIRLIDNEFFSDAENSHLSKSTMRSPIGRMEQQRLLVIVPLSAVEGGVRISYISKPTLSDLLLDSNINMNRDSLDEILVNTVAYMKAVITSQNYQVYKQENILIE